MKFETITDDNYSQACDRILWLMDNATTGELEDELESLCDIVEKYELENWPL